jgi:hypothetical protein
MRRRNLVGMTVAALFAHAVRVGAAASLSPAEVLLFETPHLSALPPVPLCLDYAFRREEAGKEPVEDRIWLEIRAAGEQGRRDVHPEFLTGPRTLSYPPARGFLGNPLLLFALDPDAREMSAATGGSLSWFRNRIRHAFAEAAELRTMEIAFDGRQVAATEIAIVSFGGEPRARRYQAWRYDFVLSDAVPGAIHTIRTTLPAGDEGGAAVESIVFVGTTPVSEGGGR